MGRPIFPIEGARLPREEVRFENNSSEGPPHFDFELFYT